MDVAGDAGALAFDGPLSFQQFQPAAQATAGVQVDSGALPAMIAAADKTRNQEVCQKCGRIWKANSAPLVFQIRRCCRQ